jgi:GH15 family glucan-1,4-alpha-glucosidase
LPLRRARASIEPGGSRKGAALVRIEDYGLIGDMQAAALVGRDGSVDWLCLPRFDSASCFAGLLGEERHGRWLLAPSGVGRASSRRYRPGTLVLETEFETADGAVRVIDFMPRRSGGLPRLIGSSRACAVECRCGWRCSYVRTTPRSCQGRACA